MILLIGIILMFQTFLSVKELEPIHFPDVGTRASGFTLVSRSTPQQLLVVQGSGDGKIRIFDPRQKNQLFERVVQKALHSGTFLQYHDRFFYFSRMLFWLDVNSLRLDSVVLRRDDYVRISWEESRGRDVLVAIYTGGTDIYELNTLTYLQTVQRDEDQQYDRPKIHDSVMVFQNKCNELQAYDLLGRKILWNLNSGTQTGYLYGIKIGTFRDFFLYYEITRETGESFVVATTIAGCLYKVRMSDGQVILKRERFKGKGNNAGLIGRFTLIDMNGDGIRDLVGGSVDYNVYCINGKDFSVLWEYNTGYENQMPCSFADVNGDGTPDVFSVNDEYRLTVLDGRTGKLIYEMIVQEGVKKGWNQTEVLLADLNGNGRLNVVVIGGWNRLRVFEISSVSVPKNEIVWIPKQ